MIDGRWVWVPDDEDHQATGQVRDTDSASAGLRLEEMWPHAPGSWFGLLLHVETGPREAPALHTLYGDVDGWDAQRGVLAFSSGPAGPSNVPVHRVIALTGHLDEHPPPLHRPYALPSQRLHWPTTGGEAGARRVR